MDWIKSNFKIKSNIIKKKKKITSEQNTETESYKHLSLSARILEKATKIKEQIQRKWISYPINKFPKILLSLDFSKNRSRLVKPYSFCILHGFRL